jgi:hypothetical protein
MKVELTSLKSEVENIGKTIKISKKAYRWSFQAHFVLETTKPNEPNEAISPELAKCAGQYLLFKVELKDSA